MLQALSLFLLNHGHLVVLVLMVMVGMMIRDYVSSYFVKCIELFLFFNIHSVDVNLVNIIFIAEHRKAWVVTLRQERNSDIIGLGLTESSLSHAYDAQNSIVGCRIDFSIVKLLFEI